MESNQVGIIISGLIFLAVVCLIFLVCREIVCWYWKINRGIALMEEQNRLLGQIVDAFHRTELNALDQQAAELRRNAVQAPARAPQPTAAK